MISLLPTILLLLVVIAVFLFLKRFADKSTAENYDERQILYRQKAYTNAAMATLIFNILVFVEGDKLERYISLSFVGVATIFLLTGIFAVSSIYYDAYFVPKKKKSFMILYSLVFFLQLGMTVWQLRDGDFFRQGHLYLTSQNSVPPLFVITFALIFLTSAYKDWRDKKEIEE